MARWWVSALTVVAFAARLALLLQSPEPPGWDGYAYVVQLERLVSTGHLHWPDASWVLFFLAALHALGVPAVLAVKVGAAALAAAAVPAAWGLGRALARAAPLGSEVKVEGGAGVLKDTARGAASSSELEATPQVRRPEGTAQSDTEHALPESAAAPSAWARSSTSNAIDSSQPRGLREQASLLPPLLLAFWAAGSPTLTHLAGDFPKNLGAVAPLLWVLSFRGGGAASRRSLAVLAVGALLAAEAHRTGAALLGVAGLGALVGAVASKQPLGRVLGVALGLIALFTAATLALPSLLHPADLERLTDVLSFSAHAPPPWGFFSLRETAWPERLELLLGWPGLAAAAWVAWARPEQRVRVAALAAPLAVCVCPLWRTDVLDLGYRLSLLAPVFAAPLLVLALPPLPVPRRWVGVVALLGAALLARTGFDASQTPPYAEWRALIARLPRPLPELLIGPQGFTFLYDHETGHEALAWSPEPGLDRARIFRLAWGVTDGEWVELAAGLAPRPVRVGADVVLVREDVWEQFLARARADGDRDLLARLAEPRNPSRVRPASLVRNR